MSDPVVNAKREKALARLAMESQPERLEIVE